jgi:hypothetical protein
MKGPVSSFMQNIKEEANKNDTGFERRSRQKRDEHL